MKDEWSGWHPCRLSLPETWMSVQVYMPDEAPLQTVREGYLVDPYNTGEPVGWYIPALHKTCHFIEVEAWKEMSEPPTGKEIEEWRDLCSGL